MMRLYSMLQTEKVVASRDTFCSVKFSDYSPWSSFGLLGCFDFLPSTLGELQVFLQGRQGLAGKFLQIRILTFVRLTLKFFDILFVVADHFLHVLAIEVGARNLR